MIEIKNANLDTYRLMDESWFKDCTEAWIVSHPFDKSSEDMIVFVIGLFPNCGNEWKYKIHPEMGMVNIFGKKFGLIYKSIDDSIDAAKNAARHIIGDIGLIYADLNSYCSANIKS